MLSQPVPLGRAFGTPRTTGNAHCHSGLEKPPSRVSVWLWQTPPGERTRSPTTRWPQSNPVEAVKRAADTAVPFRSRDFERGQRSEEHTSELQSRLHLVCRLLLEKKKRNNSICNNEDNEC